MRRLGISIYPEHSTIERDFAYLKLAHKYGYSRIFTSLLEINGDRSSIVKDFKKITSYANQLGFQTVIDINPRLFKELEVSYNNLSFFKELGVWGVRLDTGFTGMEEALMTRNDYSLKIEINMSHGTHYLDNIMSYVPDKDNLIGCHNFYPQRYTGLGECFFNKCSKQFKDYGLHTAAFVNASSASFGPWPVQDGLPTLEADRDLAIEVQIKHLMLTNLIDDMIIGNAYANEDELKAAADAFFAKQLVLRVEFKQTATDLEKEIALDNLHVYRGDQSDYLLRDSRMRVKYRDSDFPVHDNEGTIRRGDIIIVNDNYGQYKGEMQIALQNFANDGRRNVIGHLKSSDLFLLRMVKPWSMFQLV